MKIKSFFTIALPLVMLFLLTFSVPFSESLSENVTSQQILDKIDKMYRGKSSIGTYLMKIKTTHWERNLRIKSWTRDLDYTLIRIEYPKKEKGVATLKVENNLWNYLPKIKRVIKVPSSLMMGSWMGSHFTNDDLVKESTLANDYHHRITFEGKRDGQEVYEITLLPKEEAAVVWGKIVVVVRQKDLIPLYQEYCDEKEKPVRKMILSDVKKMGGRLLPSSMKVIPYDKPGEFTEIIYLDIAFDMELPETFFSLRNLKQQGD
ncbi:MAG: outer membrane lipoprotein-sorting protein [Deltaproteobacteria bacterium]|nr:outer membrane lipoprotein-sorting protein [Deltaproteobacteria bacterium]